MIDEKRKSFNLSVKSRSCKVSFHVRELACERANPGNVNDAMDWILGHEDELDNIPQTPESTDAAPMEQEEKPEEPKEEASLVAKSIKCEDCGKLFKTQTEVEFHATKSSKILTI